MSKKDEALKLALHHIEAGAHNRRYIRHVIREALAAVPEAHKQPAQQEPKPKFVRNVDGVPCITLVEHEHLMRSGSKPAQPQSAERGEPVGVWMGDCIEWTENPYKFRKGQPLYTSQPENANAGKPWRGLTDEEIEKLSVESGKATFLNDDEQTDVLWFDGDCIGLARAIEAKLREKNA